LDNGFDQKPDSKISLAWPTCRSSEISFDGAANLVITATGSGSSTSIAMVLRIKRSLSAARRNIPLIGNFYGAGLADDLVIYRSGRWYVDHFLNRTRTRPLRLAGAGDIPLVGDINGDGIADLVIYRNGLWYVTPIATASRTWLFLLAAPTGQAISVRLDGDGKADPCVYRDGIWYISTKRDGLAQVVFGYGAPGDIPLAGKFY
jgi:(2Fe-2S) ferredoxin